MSAVAVRERPILMRGEMVRAILDGRKTQTRRVVHHFADRQMRSIVRPNGTAWLTEHHCDPLGLLTDSPYGWPGDRLWVREAHAIVPRTAYAQSDGVEQALRPNDDHDAAIYREGWCRSEGGIQWRPSIHMPRWASRLTLEITDVRVERVDWINAADAAAEGFEDSWPGAQQLFKEFWNANGGKKAGCSWLDNPWVWAITFRRATP